MAETHVVSALKDKRAGLAGVIIDLERRVAQHRADLAHVDAVLRLFGETAPEAIRPKRPVARNTWFDVGECSRLTLGFLRTAERPTSTPEIAVWLMHAKGLDPADGTVRELIQKTLLGTLGRLGDTVQRLPPAEPNGPARWTIAP